MKSRVFLLCGMIAALVYVCAVFLGGIIQPGYSHISRYISDLIESGAPDRWIMDPLFGAYNLLCLVFGLGLLLLVLRTVENNRKTAGIIGSVVLLTEGLFGFATLFFPEDPAGSLITSIGIAHIVLAGLSSLTTMVAMLLLGLWLRAERQLKTLGVYSFASVAIVFAFGGITAASSAMHSPITGLLERITIGGFIQWIFVIGLVLQSKSSRAEGQKTR